MIEAFGKLYTGGDISVSFLGDTPFGVDGIKFDYEQPKENVYTMNSRKPMGRIHKAEAYTGTLTVKAVLLDSIEKLAPEGKATRIQPFTITVVAKDDEEGVLKTHVLSYTEFTKVSKSYTNANDELVHDLELAIGGITSS